MSKQKRMIYVYEENLDYYDKLENKSQFFNDALQDARINTRVKKVDPLRRMKDAESELEAMQRSDAEAIRRARER